MIPFRKPTVQIKTSYKLSNAEVLCFNFGSAHFAFGLAFCILYGEFLLWPVFKPKFEEANKSQKVEKM